MHLDPKIKICHSEKKGQSKKKTRGFPKNTRGFQKKKTWVFQKPRWVFKTLRGF